MRENWRLVAFTSAAKIYWVLVTLVTTIITARLLGPAGRGVFVAAIGWITAFATFGNLSLSQVVVFAATGKSRDEWLPRIVGSVGAILTSVFVVGTIVATVMYVATGGRVFHHIPALTLAIAFLAFPLMLWIEIGNGILMSLGKLGVLNVAQTVGASAALLLTLGAVGPLHLGVNGAVAAFVAAQALIVAISLSYVVRQARRIVVDRASVRELLRGSAKLHLNAVGTYLFAQANVLILNHYRSADETAWFQLAVQLVMGLQIVPLAVSMVTYSLVSKLGPDEAWPQQRRMLVEVLVIVVLLAGIGWLVAPFIVPALFGAGFMASVPIFRILLLSVVGSTMSIVMASQWIGRGLFVQAAMITLLIGGLAVAGTYMVVPRYGMRGAAWVTVATYGFSIIGNGIMAIWVESRVRRNRAAYA